MTVLRRLVDEIRPHWKLAVLGLVSSMLMAALELAPSVLTSSLVDTVIRSGNTSALYRICGLLLLTQIGYAFVYYGRVVFTGKLAQNVLLQLRTRLYEHLQKLSLSFYDSNRTGQLMSRATNDVSVLEQFIVGGVRDLLVNVLKLILIAGILCYHNFTLALLALVPTLPLAWATKVFNERIAVKYKTMSRRMADINSILSETLGGIRVVQTFTQEENEAGKFRDKATQLQVAGVETQRLQGIFFPGVTLAFGIGQVIVWFWGGREVLQQRMSPGDLVMFAALVAQFYAPVQALSQMSNLIASTTASGERVYEILDTQPEVGSKEDATRVPNLKGEVVFENVSFGYKASEPIIKDVTLTVSAGETVGLVGPSGSGKSTLTSLVSRFYDVTGGSVKVDGQDVREVDLKDLRRSVSMVLQEPYLFHGSIRNNIAYGRPDATFEEILEAAHAANAHQFIMDLPNSYDTEVGEHGVKLSGGQRQRISIARAILDDPKILILDEATSAVDTESEVQIQSALENLMADRTTLAIAHRLSTVQNADKIVVMDNGCIVEVGTHSELMHLDDGLYKRLVDMQSKISTMEESVA